ncbi:Uncharacterised protein [Chlamydia abortus]|nr:Uncharacterised protein [Chlamydia abortus]
MPSPRKTCSHWNPWTAPLRLLWAKGPPGRAASRPHQCSLWLCLSPPLPQHNHSFRLAFAVGLGLCFIRASICSIPTHTSPPHLCLLANSFQTLAPVLLHHIFCSYRKERRNEGRKEANTIICRPTTRQRSFILTLAALP